MSIFIHNSFTRGKEKFLPLNPPKVNMYTCGVTVYDECHIGHARSLYIFDLIKRYLIYRGFRVKFVRNITDIDDKIINKANEEGVSWDVITRRYIEKYNNDLKLLGISKADFEPQATANIEDMITHIKGLIDKGYAYESEGDVYFSVRKFPDYGKLSGQSIDQMEAGSRIEPESNKKDHLDFALWKKSKPNEPYWESPWGRGRPGWHIECSVMSMKYLKTTTLDIHAGGRDLIFPHHENEVAQSAALTGQPFAKYWIHHGLLTINGQKMSKSLGNFVTIGDFIAKYKSADVLKMFFLSAHYSHPIDYTQEKIDEARQALERILILKHKLNETPAKIKTRASSGQNSEIEYIKSRFIHAMDDDFNTPRGLACVFELVNFTNKNIDDLALLHSASIALNELLEILGIGLTANKTGSALTDRDIEAKVAQRNAARKNKDYSLSDKIRDELEQQGIILEDTKEGIRWRRKL